MARWLAGSLSVLLVTAWLMLRADAHSLRDLVDDLSGWLNGVAEVPRDLVRRLAEKGPASHELDTRPSGAPLAHGPTPIPGTTALAETVRAEVVATPDEATSAIAERRASSPAPVSTPGPGAPSEPVGEDPAGPGVEVTPEIEVDIEPVTDLLGDFAPIDFQTSLGATLSVDGLGLEVGTDVDLGVVDATVDASIRVDVPARSVDVGASLAAGPAATEVQLQLAPGELGADAVLSVGNLADASLQLQAAPGQLGADAVLSVGNLAGTSLQLQAAPGQLGADAVLSVGNLAGASLQLQAAPGQLGANVSLDLAGAPGALAVAAEPEGLTIDVSTGGLVPALLGGEVEVDADRLLIPLPLGLNLGLR